MHCSTDEITPSNINASILYWRLSGSLIAYNSYKTHHKQIKFKTNRLMDSTVESAKTILLLGGKLNDLPPIDKEELFLVVNLRKKLCELVSTSRKVSDLLPLIDDTRNQLADIAGNNQFSDDYINALTGFIVAHLLRLMIAKKKSPQFALYDACHLWMNCH